MKRLKMVAELNKKNNKNIIQNNQIKSNNKRKINSSEKQYIQAKEKNYQIQENNFNNQLTETEEKILYFWKILGVTKDYEEKFSIKLNIFHQDFHPFILEEEKKNLEKIFKCLTKITNADLTREKNIKELKRLNIILQNEKTYSPYDEIYNDIKRCLRNLKSSLLNIFNNISILRQLITYDLINNKYDLTNITFSKYFDKDYLLKLNNNLTFIREGQIGKIFKLNSPFDPLLIEFIENENETNLKNSINKESLYVLFKDLVLTGYNPVPKSVRGIKIIKNSNHKFTNNNTNSTKLLNINNRKKEEFDKSLNEINNSMAKKNIKEKEIIEAKEKSQNKDKKTKLLKKNEENEDLNVPEVNDDYINDHDDINFKEQKNDSKIFFYNNDINDLNKNYEIFFENIPKNQKNTFNLKNDIKNYLCGNNPMILLKIENNFIISLMCLSYSSDSENTLNINTFCTLNEDNNENEKIFSEFINFINEKNIKYQFITIDLYYDLIDGKFVLDKNINNIFKNLNFRWSKLENLESGVRYQQMKLVNNNFNPENDSIIEDKIMNIQSSLILYFSDNNNNNNNDNIEFNKNTNTFHLEVLDNLYNKNEENMNKFKLLFKNLFFSDKNEEIQQLLANNNFNFVLPELKNEKIFISLFNIFPQFESTMITEINNRKYIRIQTKIEVLYEKETNQLFYMIICSKDSNALLIAEVNEKFNQIISNGNIYYNFKEFYPKIENYQKQYEAIYIPLINSEKLTNNKGTINNIAGVEGVCEFWKITSGINFNKNIFILTPGENDIVIKNSCFLSLMNIDIADEFNISTVFCSFINFT